MTKPSPSYPLAWTEGAPITGMLEVRSGCSAISSWIAATRGDRCRPASALRGSSNATYGKRRYCRFRRPPAATAWLATASRSAGSCSWMMTRTWSSDRPGVARSERSSKPDPAGESIGSRQPARSSPPARTSRNLRSMVDLWVAGTAGPRAGRRTTVTRKRARNGDTAGAGGTPANGHCRASLPDCAYAQLLHHVLFPRHDGPAASATRPRPDQRARAGADQPTEPTSGWHD